MAEKYSQQWYNQRAQKAKRICNFLKNNSQNKEPIILDIGCHEGDMEEYFAEHSNGYVVGIELSLDSLRIAQKKTSNSKIDYIQGTAKNLPIREEVIDWIICNQVIDYLEIKDREKVIKEFEHVLKRNGIGYLSVGNALFLKIYKMFPFIFSSVIDSDYGKKSTSSNKQDVIPMNYDFWKQEVCRNNRIEVFDVSENIIDLDGLEKQNKKINELKKKIIKITYKIFRKISPTWIFLIKKENKV